MEDEGSMKATGTIPTTGAFTIKRRGNKAIITFYWDASPVDPTGETTTDWQWNQSEIEREYRDGLYADVEANYDSWLSIAMAEEEARTPVDEWQLRADVDFLQITQAAAMGISLMSEGSGLDVLDKARQYYPKRWSKEQLQMLVQMQKLSAEDYQALTGEALSA